MQKVIAKINITNIRNNAKVFKERTKRKLCAVVKANAYGHGAEEVVNALEQIADCFAVALIEEGLSIRTVACGKDILIFTPPLTEEEVVSIAENNFTATVADLWTAKLVLGVCEKRNLRIKVHLKVNTGMNRYGMNGSMLGKVCKLFCGKDCVQVEGIYSHLYAFDRSKAVKQRDLFMRFTAIAKRYFPDITAHLGGTYAAMLDESFFFDMTRVGIGLYGYLPIESEKKDFAVKKAMQVYARTITNRTYAFGGKGYGKDCSKKERFTIKRLSVCRFGYADGFLRKRKNGVVAEEENANNLCMDVCIRKNGKRRGTLVPVLLDAEETARKTGTISYEVLCAATRRAECIYENE